MDKSGEIKPKFFWYRRALRGREIGAGQKGYISSMKCRLTLGLNWRAVLASGILISFGELANSFIQTFISWRICYSQVAVSQIALLCLVPHPFYPSLSPSPHTISEGLGGIEENIIVSHSLWSQNSNYLAIRRQYVLGIGRASYIESYFARVNCTIHVSHLEETEWLSNKFYTILTSSGTSASALDETRRRALVAICNRSHIPTQISDSCLTRSVFSKTGELTVHRPKATSSSSGDLSGFMPARTANYTPRKKTQTLYVTAKLPHRGGNKRPARRHYGRGKYVAASCCRRLVKRERGAI